MLLTKIHNDLVFFFINPFSKRDWYFWMRFCVILLMVLLTQESLHKIERELVENFHWVLAAPSLNG